MKLLRAEFKNFRLLRDLKLEFATEQEKHLTVIRAANDSGKTTILYGLQWALYGDEVLPNKGKGFRLHPIDWDVSEGERVPITVILDFELTTCRWISGKVQELHRCYRLVRSAVENIDSEEYRSASTVNLFNLKESGTTPISAPESIIKDSLPLELHEVVFTDGDKVLSFIDTSISTHIKRSQVRKTIHYLLSLGVIDDAIKHVQKSVAEVNKEAKQLGGDDGKLNKIVSDLEAVESDQEKLEKKLEDAKQKYSAFEEMEKEADRNIGEALRKGDKEKLNKDIEEARGEKKQIEEQLKTAKKDHSELFRSQSIATGLLIPVLSSALDRLEELHNQGEIPNITIPVLRDCLKEKICICGETLEPEDLNGKKRRDYIQNLIDDSASTDKIRKVLTDLLYYGVRPLQSSGDVRPNTWLEDYKEVHKRRDKIETRQREAGRKLRLLEQQVDSLPNVDIQRLKEERRQHREQRDRHLKEQTYVETKLDNLRRECEKLRAERDSLLRKQKKGARILAEQEVREDVVRVLKNSYDQITNQELQKVSDLMNSIFLKMIGNDPEQGAIIMRAEISQNFDIIVYGSNDRVLPYQDLNGASRRALTLAFILALTKVSEVEVPNVIDTPLGMTSGYVRQSVLRTAVRESSQLILFLTHDEIAGCEKIIDKSAGIVFTLTNPAHYPKMLVNDPSVVERKILRCDCDHRSNCQLCQRRLDTEPELL